MACVGKVGDAKQAGRIMLEPARPLSPTARLLAALLPLDALDIAAITQAASEATREITARRDAIREGDRQRSVLAVVEGWGCRYKHLPDGRRQIVSILLPGDLGDAITGSVEQMDYSIGALTTMQVAEIGIDRVQALREQHPSVALAIARHERMKLAIQREWTTSLGQRTAIERIAHLLCELFFRLERIGGTDRLTCDFPLTQNDIADACGLTSVHVNRTIQELRREGLIAIGRRQLEILDLAGLVNRALFDPAYLHFAQPSAVFPNG
jgi:CRP-like cAMP-binding protein